MVITIDGLGVNGKSTLAKMISQKLNYKNFNTGAIYRCIALKIINDKLDVSDISNIILKIKDLEIDFIEDKVYLDGKEVTSQIRTEEISIYSTKWATIPEIKEIVRNIQRNFILKNDTVMEGRDIATRIAPNADIKFYLYSDFETRVNRLWLQEKSVDIEVIRNNLKERDNLDINGGNFIKPLNAIEINTTNLSLNEVYEIMMKNINEIKCKMTKNIIFDLGNVIINYNQKKIINNFTNNIDEEKYIFNQIFQAPEWALMDLGNITNDEAIDVINERNDHKYDELTKKFLHEWYKKQPINKDIVKIAKDLKEKGYNIFVLSNMAIETYEYFKNDNFFKLCTGIIISAVEHVKKPSEEIYKILLSRYNLKAEECLFIDDDDSGKNYETANRIGILGRRIIPNQAEDVKKMLLEYSIEI